MSLMQRHPIHGTKAAAVLQPKEQELSPTGSRFDCQRVKNVDPERRYFFRWSEEAPKETTKLPVSGKNCYRSNKGDTTRASPATTWIQGKHYSPSDEDDSTTSANFTTQQSKRSKRTLVDFGAEFMSNGSNRTT
eukprot:jgi/Psemu1/8511/gm1.8511_g